LAQHGHRAVSDNLHSDSRFTQDALGELLADLALNLAYRAVARLDLADQGDDDLAAGIDLKLAIATQGKRINLPGGLPIIVDGHVIGGIGVGSGTGEQDKQVANAALRALSGARTF